MAPSEFFPLTPGLRWAYEHRSSEFEGVEIVELALEALPGTPPGSAARATLLRHPPEAPSREYSYDIRATGTEVFSEGGILGLTRREFPLPPKVGQRWVEPPDINEIVSDRETVNTPAGEFSGCLKVNTYLAAGDSGCAVRYYAPGVGYVFEEYSSETWGAQVKLIRFSR